MTLGIYEISWMKQILEDLKIQHKGPIKLSCDNNQPIIL